MRSRRGRLDKTASTACSVVSPLERTTTLSTRPPECRTPTHLLLSRTSIPRSSTLPRKASHICPGPSRGYRNSSIRVGAWPRRSPITPSSAWNREKDWIR
jgi:hypothetical protein